MGKNLSTLSAFELIDRRSFLEVTGLGLAGLASGALIKSDSLASPTSNEQPGEKRPNIILLIADDTGWRDVGYHGSKIDTPNLDRLARNSVVLEQFYSCPTCSPTRASLLMGRPASRFGILAPIAGRSELSLPLGKPTLASFLRDTGYETALIGKWHLGLKPEVGPRQYGFDHSYGYLHGQIDQFSHIYKNGDRTWHRDEKFIDEKGHATDLMAGEAIRMIQAGDKSKPFFLYVSFSVPHYPLQEEEKWVKPYESRIANKSRRLYAASMTHMDDALGRILRALEEKNLATETLVVFMSDNGAQENWMVTEGEYEGRHGPNDRLGDNLPFRGWKGSCYEGGIRVPALFYKPGALAPCQVNLPFHVIDLVPTLADFAQAKVPPSMEAEGIDIRPALTGKFLPVERTLYWNTGGQLAVRRGDWKLIHNGPSLTEGTDELYNIAEDPYEKKNLVQGKFTLAGQMREILAREMALDRAGE